LAPLEPGIAELPGAFHILQGHPRNRARHVRPSALVARRRTRGEETQYRKNGPLRAAHATCQLQLNCSEFGYSGMTFLSNRHPVLFFD
jgi:hypothetical protein